MTLASMSLKRSINLLNCVQNCLNKNRFYSASAKDIKRFYKDVTLTKNNGSFEINLDRHKLRTPLGNIVQIPSEPIALGVAEEWRTQDKLINRHNMQLTTLANMCIDRKELREQETTINKMLEFLNTDTVCFRADNPEELVHLQEEKWDPLLDWMEKRFEVKIPVTTGLSVPNFPMETRDKLVMYLKSFSDWALVGYEQAVECLKSFVIGTAVVNRKVSVEEAVRLSCLELEFQTNVWGTVEWKHTVDEVEMKARLAAAMLFVHFNSTHYNVTEKRDNYHMK